MLRRAFKGVKYLHIECQRVQEGFLTLKIGKHHKIPNYCTKFHTCSFNTSLITKKKKRKTMKVFACRPWCHFTFCENVTLKICRALFFLERLTCCTLQRVIFVKEYKSRDTPNAVLSMLLFLSLRLVFETLKIINHKFSTSER